jgi:hypothetical protein
VRKEPLQTAPIISADGVTTLEVPDQFATVRTNPVTGRPDVLGVVGRGYTPIQNEEHATLLDALVAESGSLRVAFRDRRFVEGWPAGVHHDEAPERHAGRGSGPGRPVPGRVEFP